MVDVIHTIITHVRPHLDEITAIWLLKKFGDAIFPGIGSATVTFVKNGTVITESRTAEELETEGILLLGIGGGRFDEHPTADTKRKEKECAATLVAKTLGVNDDPALARILKYVANNDLKGSVQPFDFAYITQAYHEQHPDDHDAIIRWVMFALDVEYNKQRRFLDTPEEFRKNALIEDVSGLGGKPVRMVTIKSDNEQMGRFARSAHGCGAAVVIQMNSRGNVAILTDHRSGIKLFDVARMIRLAEKREKGNFPAMDWNTMDTDALGSEGKMNGAEEWFFHHKMQALFNGSLTTPNTTPTRITLDEIRQLVRIGLSKMLLRNKLELAAKPTKSN